MGEAYSVEKLIRLRDARVATIGPFSIRFRDEWKRSYARARLSSMSSLYSYSEVGSEYVNQKSYHRDGSIFKSTSIKCSGEKPVLITRDGSGEVDECFVNRNVPSFFTMGGCEYVTGRPGSTNPSDETPADLVRNSAILWSLLSNRRVPGMVLEHVGSTDSSKCFRGAEQMSSHLQELDLEFSQVDPGFLLKAEYRSTYTPGGKCTERNTSTVEETMCANDGSLVPKRVHIREEYNGKIELNLTRTYERFHIGAIDDSVFDEATYLANAGSVEYGDWDKFQARTIANLKAKEE